MGTVSSTMARSGQIWIFVCLLPCTFTLAPVSRSQISVNFCCEDGSFLKRGRFPTAFDSARNTAQCTDEEQFPPLANMSSLEWTRTSVLLNGELTEMSIRKSGVKSFGDCFNTRTRYLDISGPQQNRSDQGF